ncbi:MAG TPA: antibiotic biosynthesis monooxygenase [Polyangiaceae bacterium]|nr:antibiotic biosynthesis monooxygenase [Polyangiaceae bacterium]
MRLEAKPGQEQALADFLRSALPLVEAEPDTTTWYAIKLGPSTFAIYDTFAHEAGRQAHLDGKVAAALGEKASELLASSPSIERVEVLAAKVPR